jgi:hypothetical protein
MADASKTGIELSMAHLKIDDESIVVVLSGAERVEALHANVTVPRSAVHSARAVVDGMDEVHGIRSPGTALPGVIMVGTWRSSAGTTFAVCHGRRPAILIELTGQPFDRLVITVNNPEEAAAALSAKPATG